MNHSKLQRAAYVAAMTVGMFVGGAGLAWAATTIGADITSDGILTINGNVDMDDGVAGDTIAIGDSGDTVTVLGNISLTDTQWGVTAAGVANFASIEGTAIGNVTRANGAFAGLSNVGTLDLGTTNASEDVFHIFVNPGGSARYTGQLTNNDLTAARTWYLPNASGTFVTTGNLDAITSLGSISSIDRSGAITIGSTNATGIGIGRSGIFVTISGSLSIVGGGLNFNNQSDNLISMTENSTGAAEKIVIQGQGSSALNVNAGSVVLVGGTATGGGTAIPGHVHVGGAGAAPTLTLGPNDLMVEGILETGGAAKFGGNLTLGGTATFAGNVTFGDAATDKVIFNATTENDIIPFAGGVDDLGSAANRFNDVYLTGKVDLGGNIVQTGIGQVQTGSGGLDLNGALFVSAQTYAGAGTNDTTAEYSGYPLVFLTKSDGAQVFNLGSCAANASKFVRIYVKDTNAFARTINATNAEGITPFAGGAKADIVMGNNAANDIASATFYCDGTDWMMIDRTLR